MSLSSTLCTTFDGNTLLILGNENGMVSLINDLNFMKIVALLVSRFLQYIPNDITNDITNLRSAKRLTQNNNYNYNSQKNLK